MSLTPMPRAQHQILVDHNPQRPAGPHLDHGLDGEVFGHKLLAGLGCILLGGFAQRADEIAFIADKRQLSANANSVDSATP